VALARLSASGFRLSVGFGAAVLTVAILSSSSGMRAAAPEDELPEGEGKKILVSSCTACHDLTEVTKFRGYYDGKQWRDIVITMMDYGAPVDEKQVDILADYLAKNLGKQ
jgi:competence protein ComEA